MVIGKENYQNVVSIAEVKNEFNRGKQGGNKDA